LLHEIMEHHAVAPPELSRLAGTVSSIIAAPDHCFVVADEDGQLVGMCGLIFSVSTWSAAPVCELQDVIVDREHRREDVGRGLVRAAEEIARARGCMRLFLLASRGTLGRMPSIAVWAYKKTCLYFERTLITCVARRARGDKPAVRPGDEPALAQEGQDLRSSSS
jgi:GNAT superfamily N-acetyltransferase